MKYLIILLLPLSTFAQTHCLPLSESRAIHAMALRSVYLDTIVGKQSDRIALDSIRINQIEQQSWAERTTLNSIIETYKADSVVNGKIIESYRKENKDLRKGKFWKAVKPWLIAAAAGYLGYQIGDKL